MSTVIKESKVTISIDSDIPLTVDMVKILTNALRGTMETTNKEIGNPKKLEYTIYL